MSPFDISEFDKVTLLTLDEPPVRHSIPRSHLSTLSTAFKDMFPILFSPDGIPQSEIPIEETDSELKGFLRMLESLGRGEEADLSELKFLDWENLARLSDKYDSIMARMRVKSHVWGLIAKGVQLEHAFYLAVTLEDTELIQHTSIVAIPRKWHLNEKVPQEWQNRINNAYRYRRIKVFEHLVSCPFDNWQCSENCNRFDVEAARESACYAVLRSYSLDETVGTQLLRQFDLQDPKLCFDHQVRFMEKASYADDGLTPLLDLSKGLETPRSSLELSFFLSPSFSILKSSTMPLSTSTEEAQFVLVTSDNPPISHTVSRSRLCALSKTFDNLLSLPTGLATDDSANKMELTETSVELEGFLKVIRGEEVVEGDFSGGGTFDVIHSSDEENEGNKVYWISLARMADKYDCPTARLYVTSLLWRLKAQHSQLDVVFHLAIGLNDYQLVQQTCGPAMENDWHISKFVPDQWKDRLVSHVSPRVSFSTAASELTRCKRRGI
ncbi:hypothetical protein JCM5353_007830 [Sporobolomyces roseus]